MFKLTSFWVLVVLMVVVSACSVGGGLVTKPVTLIASPANASTFTAGDTVSIQSSSADPIGISRIELSVDGTIVRNDAPPTSQTNFTLIQTWTAQPGAHTISVRAYNTTGVSSDPAAISVVVTASSGSSPTSTPVPGIPGSGSPSPTLVPGSGIPVDSSASPTPVPSATLAPVAGKPDLFVSEFALTPGTPTQGSNVHVRLGIYNQGTAPVTAPFKVEWWAGSNYPAATCTWTVDSLAAKGGRILECDKSDAWASWYAKITTRVKVDPINVVSESDEGNNIKDTEIQVVQAVTNKPDLFVSEYSLNPSPPTQGSNVHVRVGVYNQGTAAVSTPFKVEWWAGSNYPAAACSWTVDSLAAKGGRILECDKSDAWASWYGNITTRVKVDPLNAVGESDESNNVKDVDTQVKQPVAAAKPDLYVSEYSLNPSPPTQGSNVHVRVGVYNQGTAAVSTPFKVEWWAGSNYPAAACSWTVDSLAAHGGRILECDKSDAWASWYGNITTRVKVDSLNAVSESDEGNNVQDMDTQVKQPAAAAKPDLYVSEFTLTPNPPTHTANVHVRIGVYNQGAAAATTSFKVEWYAGSNYATPACTWTVDSLAAHGGRILECDKANAWASNYANITTRVKVDPLNTVSESNESNNINDVNIKVN